MCLHLVGLITIYVLPRFIRGERKASNTKEATTNGVSQAPPVDQPINGIMSNGSNGNRQHVQCLSALNKNGFLNAEPHIIDNNHCDINVNEKKSLVNGEHVNGMPLTNGSSHINRDNDTSLSTPTTTTTTAATTATTTTPTQTPANETDTQQTNEYRQEKSTENHLSIKIRERIDSETRNIEELIDKTVTGIVELKDDLMRVNNDEMYVNAAKYEFSNGHTGGHDDGLRRRNLTDLTNGKEIEAFLRKEINAVNVAGVLSNGHVD